MSKTDILLLGATGYTGGKVAHYLANHPERASFSFALGGRSYDKLQKVVSQNGLDPKRTKLVEVDLLDEVRIREIVKNYHVVISTIGPYWEVGNALVQACAEAGVNYTDVTGEAPFIQWCIDNCDYVASKNHSCIINAAGLACIPSDIAVYLANETLKKASGPHTSCGESVSAFDFDMSGGVSAGSLSTSALHISRGAQNSRSQGGNALSPAKGKQWPKLEFIRRVPRTNVVGALQPFFFLDEQMVRRSWGLYKLKALKTKSLTDQNKYYGDEFIYQELRISGSWRSAFAANFWWILTLLVLWIPLLSKVVLWWYREPGGGPPDESLLKGWLRIVNITTSAPQPTKEAEIIVKTTIEGYGEPAYFLTSIMLVETALLLLPKHSHKLTEMGKQGGVLTPMTAIGQPLIDRLAATGKFSFSSEVVRPKKGSTHITI